MKRMIERSKFTGNEVCAAILEDGNVVIFHDEDSTPESCYAYYALGIKDGKRVELYKNKVIDNYMHTHPHTGCLNNPLCISDIDINNAISFNNEINILLLNGDFYRQSTLPGQSTYIPNYRGNVYDPSFHF